MFGALRKRADQSRLRWLLAPAVGVIVTGSLLASGVPAQAAPAPTRGTGVFVDLSTGEMQTTGDAHANMVACTVVGTPNQDILWGTDGDDVICGMAGSDVLIGGLGNDVLVAGRGRDHLDGGMGDDILRGNAGDDVLGGDEGADTLNGGPDADRCVGGAGTDTGLNCEYVNGIP